MAVDLDATVGGAESNSYSTVANADSLASARVGPSAASWVDSTDDDAKAQALITATLAIDSLPFIGVRSSSTQALEWPRTSAKTITGRLYASDSLPYSLVAATVELAINYLANASSDVTSPVANDKKKVKAGDVEVEYFTPSNDDSALSMFPDLVARLLEQLVLVPVVGVWGSGTAVRAS